MCTNIGSLYRSFWELPAEQSKANHYTNQLPNHLPDKMSRVPSDDATVQPCIMPGASKLEAPNQRPSLRQRRTLWDICHQKALKGSDYKKFPKSL